MWQYVKSELRDVCSSQPQPFGKKYLFSWAARSKLLWAWGAGGGATISSINFNLNLRKGHSWKALVQIWMSQWNCNKSLRGFKAQRSSRHNSWVWISVLFPPILDITLFLPCDTLPVQCAVWKSSRSTLFYILWEPMTVILIIEHLNKLFL